MAAIKMNCSECGSFKHCYKGLCSKCWHKAADFVKQQEVAISSSINTGNIRYVVVAPWVVDGVCKAFAFGPFESMEEVGDYKSKHQLHEEEHVHVLALLPAGEPLTEGLEEVLSKGTQDVCGRITGEDHWEEH